jgi:Glycosyltransferase family 9 (heptosyltransferase)
VLVLTPRAAGSIGPADHIRWGREHGVRTVLAPTRRSDLLHGPLVLEQPDLVLAWNELQARAARKRHGVSPDAVRVTGAVRYDDRLDVPSPAGRTRRRILYICAPSTAGRREAFCFERWVKRVREEPVLGEVAIAVRPSPYADATESARVRMAAVQLSGVELMPEEQYLDALATSTAVVVADADAALEAAIAGRSAHVISSPEMLTVEGERLSGDGTLRWADTWWKHADDLIAAVEAGSPERVDFRPFVEAIVRPGGAPAPVAPVVAEAIERVAGTSAAPVIPSLIHRVVRSTLELAVALVRWIARARAALRLVYRAVAVARRTGVRRAVAPAARSGARAVMSNPVGRIALRSPLLPARRVRKRVRSLASHPTTLVTANGDHRNASLDAIRDTVDVLARGTGPVVAGAWRGDLALELLLWRPFLLWVAGQHQELASRLVVVSRGRVANWYADVSRAYVDLADLFDYPPANVARHANAVELGKAPRALDDDELDLAVRDAILSDDSGAFLSPALLREAYVARVKGNLSQLAPILDARPLSPGPTPSPVELPPRGYTVAAFPYSELFPETAENREAAAALIASVTADRPVVVVGGDLPRLDGTDAAVALPAIGAGTSLAQFQALVAGAHSFVGSWSGLAHLGSAVGVPVTAMYSNHHAKGRVWFKSLLRIPREPEWGPFRVREVSASGSSVLSVGAA